MGDQLSSIDNNVRGLFETIFDTSGPTEGQLETRERLNKAGIILSNLTVLIFGLLLIVWLVSLTFDGIAQLNAWGVDTSISWKNWAAIAIVGLEALVLATFFLRGLVRLFRWIRATDILKLFAFVEIIGLFVQFTGGTDGERKTITGKLIDRISGSSMMQMIGVGKKDKAVDRPAAIMVYPSSPDSPAVRKPLKISVGQALPASGP